jgi:hypothetical protein
MKITKSGWSTNLAASLARTRAGITLSVKLLVASSGIVTTLL